MNCSVVMVLKISKRSNDALKVQEILSKEGCIINLRVGLHETFNQCSEEGLIILHLCGENDDISKLENELKKLQSVKVYKIEIN